MTLAQHSPAKKTRLHSTFGFPSGWRNVCKNDECGKYFDSKRRDAKFCSSACRQKYARDKKRALTQLQIALLDAQAAARRFSDSQEVYDQAIVLFKGLEAALGGFNPVWVQKSFAPPANHGTEARNHKPKRYSDY